MSNFIMFLKLTRTHFKLDSIVVIFTKLYKNLVYYIITMTLNVHGKLEILSKI